MSMEMKFAERIKELRTENGLSQSKFAEKININQSAVAKWELGELEPNLTMLMKIAVKFDVSADYLLGLKDY